MHHPTTASRFVSKPLGRTEKWPDWRHAASRLNTTLMFRIIGAMTGITSTEVLAAFELRSRGAKRALVRREWADAIGTALLDGVGCVPAEVAGRGALLRFPYERGWGLLRQYRRGGALRHLLRDRYVLINRPLRELRIHAYLFQAGLPLPEPLGICWERRGLLLRGALATHEVEAVNLRPFLAQERADSDDVLRRAGALVRRMHDCGVFHADLQLANILVGESQLYLIDFDKARLSRPLTRLRRARNLLRLRRSLEKNGFAGGHFRAICEGYGMEDVPRWADCLYRAKGWLSDRISGRETHHDDADER